MISVLLHEFESPYNGLMVHEPHRKAAVENKIPQTIGSDAIRCQQMEGFSEDRDGRTERVLYCFERVLALLMFCVLPIKQPVERAGIDENQLRCFRFNAATTPRCDSVEGAIAYPPGPRSKRRYTS
jgi:hypothetical protein